MRLAALTSQVLNFLSSSLLIKWVLAVLDEIILSSGKINA
jgi:hypothetical protein